MFDNKILAFTLSSLNCSKEIFTYRVYAYQFSSVIHRLILLKYNLISCAFSPPLDICMKSAFRDLRGDLNNDFFSALFHEIQIAINFLQHQFYGNSASSTVKNDFEQIFPFFSFIFCWVLCIICYIVIDRKLWSSCKVIRSLSFPINSRSLYKTFFCFSEINDKIDFEMKVEGSSQFITSENEKILIRFVDS